MGKRFRWETWGVVAAVTVGLAIVAALVWGIGEQVERLRSIQASEAELRPLLAREEARQERLLEELAHVSSPDYSERWARAYGGMARPGEVLLVVSLPEESTEAPSPSPPAEADSFWSILSHWLFGDGD